MEHIVTISGMEMMIVSLERHSGLTQLYNEARTLWDMKEKQKKATKTRMITRKT